MWLHIYGVIVTIVFLYIGIGSLLDNSRSKVIKDLRSREKFSKLIFGRPISNASDEDKIKVGLVFNFFGGIIFTGVGIWALINLIIELFHH